MPELLSTSVDSKRKQLVVLIMSTTLRRGPIFPSTLAIMEWLRLCDTSRRSLVIQSTRARSRECSLISRSNSKIVGDRDAIVALEKNARGRPLLLGKEIDGLVIKYICAVRDAGGIVIGRQP